MLPRVHQLDVTGLEVGDVAGGEGEVVDLGGRGDEGVLKGCVMLGPEVGRLFGDGAIHADDLEPSGMCDQVVIPSGKQGCENRIARLDFSQAVTELVQEGVRGTRRACEGQARMALN